MKMQRRLMHLCLNQQETFYPALYGVPRFDTETYTGNPRASISLQIPVSSAACSLSDLTHISTVSHVSDENGITLPNVSSISFAMALIWICYKPRKIFKFNKIVSMNNNTSAFCRRFNLRNSIWICIFNFIVYPKPSAPGPAAS